MASPDQGDKAPDFTLPADPNGMRRLSDLRGKPVVLFFYPKDSTEACTKEAVAFSERKGDFEALGVTVLGISPDTLRRHQNFRRKFGLTVELLSDPHREAIGRYGLWVEKSMYGRKYMGVDRTTFLIAPDGCIAKVWRKVKVTGHVEEVLAAAAAL